MAEINVHGHNVIYDDKDHTLKQAVKHLAEKLDSSEVKPLFDEAHHDHVNGIAHFEFRDHDRHEDRNATLVHIGDGKYELRHREHGIFK